MTSWRGLWRQPRLRPTWNQRGSVGKMGRGRMGQQWCRGKEDESLSGTLPALTPLPLHTYSWPPEKQVLWQTGQTGEKWQSTSSWLLHTTSYQRPLSLRESLDPRHMPSSASLAVASRRKQGNPYPPLPTLENCGGHPAEGNAAAVLGTSPPGDTDPIFIR